MIDGEKEAEMGDIVSLGELLCVRELSNPFVSGQDNSAVEVLVLVA
jgi:hypothetical protein